MSTRFVLAAVLAAIVAIPLTAQVQKQDIPGIRNYSRVDATVGCGGAVDPAAMSVLKKEGYVSVINLRLASEEGVDIEGASAAAKAVDLNYIHIPFSSQTPEAAAADRFLGEIAKPANEPAFIHCAGGNRAASMWLIKRLAVDHWDVDRAVKEAAALGQTSEPLRTFAIEYAKANKR